jgi:hypothetical protein
MQVITDKLRTTGRAQAASAVSHNHQSALT